MPRLWKTVLPRIRRSLRERGAVATLRSSLSAPLRLFREYRSVKSVPRAGERSDFDREFGVDTDGEFNGWTHLSDLEIKSRNWIEGVDYTPIPPRQFAAAMAAVPLRHEDFTFIDFGSGKGRALLLASEYPFRRVIGVEFSPELHAIAQANIARDPARRCAAVESVCMDFTEYALPPEPSLLYFFSPASARVLEAVIANLGSSLTGSPRQIWVLYIAPQHRRVMDECGFLWQTAVSEEHNFCVFTNQASGELPGIDTRR